MKRPLTASMLYNLVHCPHRLALDIHGDPAERDEVSRFVKLLWEKGNVFEEETIERLDEDFTDLSGAEAGDVEALTSEAIARQDALIYGGRISAGDLLGAPDLLRRDGEGYVAGDIKSGVGADGGSDLTDGRPKDHYAVQLALYTDILEKKEIASGRTPFIWDVHGEEVVYDLDQPRGKRDRTTLWEFYEERLDRARRILSKQAATLPALSSKCKLCHWYSVCIPHIERLDDLTMIPYLGRSSRDSLARHFKTVSDLARADVIPILEKGKTGISGVGVKSLERFHARAILLTNPGKGPHIRRAIDFPDVERELFFDIEADPMRDLCYLHGFVERRGRDNGTERYLYFLAEAPTPEEEERAFGAALEYIRGSKPCAIYYYSKYERTFWRKLQERYPGQATPEEIEEIFDPATAVDLYNDVVKPHTEWPTRDHSIKTLARYLGFDWRDESPSGAESIEWYHRWVEEGDDAIGRRILDYNEDDCKATRALLDGIRALPVRRA